MENTQEPKKPSSGSRIAIGVVLYGLWMVWVALIHPLKITSFVVAPQTQQGMEALALASGVVKMLLVAAPYFGIRAIMKKR